MGNAKGEDGGKRSKNLFVAYYLWVRSVCYHISKRQVEARNYVVELFFKLHPPNACAHVMPDPSMLYVRFHVDAHAHAQNMKKGRKMCTRMQ